MIYITNYLGDTVNVTDGRLISIANTLGVTLIDIAPTFHIAIEKGEVLAIPGDDHMTLLAHALVAQGTIGLFRWCGLARR